MIESLKKNMTKKNIVAYVLFGAIIIVFVLFGFQTVNNPGLGSYAARVNDTIIPIADFDQARERLTQMYSSFMGEAINTPEYQNRIKFDALNQLIQREVLAQVAEKQGIMISDSEIRDIIMKFPQFQEAGVFQRSYYENYLKISNTNAGRFESSLKKDRAIARLRATLQESFEPFDMELKKIQKLKSKTYNLEYVKFDDEDFKKNGKVSSQEVKDFLNDKDNVLRVQFEFDKLKEQFKDKKLEDVQDKIAKDLLLEEKSQKVVEELSMKLQNTKEFEAEVARLGLKWQKATPVSQDSDRIAEIGQNEKLMNSLPGLVNPGDYVKEVVSTPQGQFVVRLKSIETKELKEGVDQVKTQINSQRSNEVLSQWLEELAKDYHIERNEVLLR